MNFKPTKVAKATDDAEYSDKINTDDEIQETLHAIEASNKKASISTENLDAEKQ